MADPTEQDRARAADPLTFSGILGTLAEEHPSLWPVLAANPSTPVATLQNLRDQGDESVQAALGTNATAVGSGLVVGLAPPVGFAPPATTATAVNPRTPGVAATSAGTTSEGTSVATTPSHSDSLKRPLVIIGVLLAVAAITSFFIVRALRHDNGSSAAPTTAAPLPPSSAQRPSSTTVAPTTVAATLPPTAPPTTPAPTTTTTRPPTPEQLALALAQQVATLQATGDWKSLRAFTPDNQLGDAEYETLFPNLDRSTVVFVTSSMISPGRYDLRLGLVDNESPPTGPQTTLRCAHWIANIGTNTVRRVDVKPLRTDPGTEDPAAVSDQLRQACLTAKLG